MKSISRCLLLMSIAVIVSACGGGGGGGGGGPVLENKDFSLSLNSVDLSRTNSGELTVDTSGIASGEKVYNPN